MKPVVPNQFRTATIVDCENVNDNLRGISKDIFRSNERRYTYCSIPVQLAALDGSLSAEAQTIRFRVPEETFVEVQNIEFTINNGSSGPWTMTINAPTTGDVQTTADGYCISTMPFTLDGNGDNEVSIALSGPSIDTIDASITINIRCDRFRQLGAYRIDYDPTLLTAASSTVETVITDETDQIATAVANDTASDTNLRCMCVCLSPFAVATSVRFPSGTGFLDPLAFFLSAVGAGPTVDIDFNSGPITSVTTTNVNTTITNSFVQPAYADDPLVPASDIVVNFGLSAPVDLCYAFIWWK